MTINYNVLRVGSQIVYNSGNLSQSGSLSATSGNFTALSVNNIPFNEIVDDEVANLLVAGTGVSLAYNDNANTLTINTNTNVNNASNLYLWSTFR